MQYTILDCESTGLSTNTASPVSVAYLILNEKFERVDSKILYFSHESIPESDPGALEVHGLTRQSLMKYRKDYERNLRLLYRVMHRGNIIGHNVRKFDITLLCNFLERNKLERPVIANVYDTMEIYNSVFKGKKKLTFIADYCNISEETVKILASMWFENDEKSAMDHDASYDVTKNALVFIEAVKNKLVRGVS